MNDKGDLPAAPDADLASLQELSATGVKWRTAVFDVLADARSELDDDDFIEVGKLVTSWVGEQALAIVLRRLNDAGGA